MGGGTKAFHRKIRVRALVAEKRFLVSEKTLHASARIGVPQKGIDRANVVIDGMTAHASFPASCYTAPATYYTAC